MPTNKIRIDRLLVERGLAHSRTLAQRLVMAGQVRANGEIVHKPSNMVEAEAQIEVDSGPRFVSRGGEKLAASLEAFELNPVGWKCVDIGSSTGGFTDCLLQAGAEHVYAVDVGHGQLHWKLRNDSRVTAMEGVNARELVSLPARVDLAVIDVSFISLRLIFPQVARWLVEAGQVIALVKPQFEAGKDEVGKGGVVSEPATHKKVLEKVTEAAVREHLEPRGMMRSPLIGPKGNVEFLLWMQQAASDRTLSEGISAEKLIESVL
jgi:23S rRNA (cytidine1920-2'-O)/16S rRNA (cytidine1409-2'-O)-methyltransferase